MKSRKTYENPSGHIQDSIEIKSRGWGYICLEAQADGDFIHLLKAHRDSGGL